MENNIENTLREYFATQKTARLSFLMGSHAKGTARKDSDVDVAVLFDVPPDIVQVTSLREKLVLLLKKEVDLVLLNLAGPVIRMQALKTGKVLYAKKGAYEEFFTRTLNEYTDLKFFRKEAEEKIMGRKIYA
ncbi:MAG TPA: nucleotidyltransferase domain-containing protein [Synergistales bacterium]|nr:nucleotidyltransferase domain-containing protein [Synergistales bacterium]